MFKGESLLACSDELKAILAKQGMSRLPKTQQWAAYRLLSKVHRKRESLASFA
jgi:hypothetical protein